jgi:DNA-binding NtrC family response regulator
MSFRPGLEFDGALRVALADDEPIIRHLTEQMLLSMGAQVTTVTSGAALAALLDAGSFDLVVTDVDMPGLKGTDVLVRRRILGDVTPFVVITGNPYVVESSVKRHTAAVILSKPFSLNDLEDAITDVLIAGQHALAEAAVVHQPALAVG